MVESDKEDLEKRLQQKSRQPAATFDQVKLSGNGQLLKLKLLESADFLEI